MGELVEVLLLLLDSAASVDQIERLSEAVQDRVAVFIFSSAVRISFSVGIDVRRFFDRSPESRH